MSVRVGVVGSGWVAERHVAALRSLDAEIVAIAGRNGASVAKLCAESGAKAYQLDAVRDMLRSERLDAVFLLLPPHLHGPIEAACAEHVPAVFIEKPITTDLEVARRAHEELTKAGTLVSVGFMCRYRETVQRLRAELAREEDPPVLVNGAWVGDMPGPLWWRARAQSGGQFLEQTTHLVDLSRYLVGDIVEVSSFTARGFIRDVPGYTVDDASVVNVRFAGGAIGTFASGCFVTPPSASAMGIGLTLQCRGRHVSLNGWDMHLKLQRGAEIERLCSTEADIFAVEDAAFLAAFRARDASLVRSSYADAIETLKVALAATLSASSGRAVAPASL
jgi:myo-inositol 2-dehydrogenase / D-chiro-inositol 1-dehydrogenase